MKKFRALSCLVLALCLVFYAVPRLPVGGVSELASGFSLIWTIFAMVVIGSNLLYVIGDDRSGLDKRKRMLLLQKDKVRIKAPMKKRASF